MENQHKKIKGYRDLTQSEIDLMNRLKEKGEEMGLLLSELKELREDQWAALHNTPDLQVNGLGESDIGESHRCIALGKTNMQQGLMWAVRAVTVAI